MEGPKVQSSELCSLCELTPLIILTSLTAQLLYTDDPQIHTYPGPLPLTPD